MAKIVPFKGLRPKAAVAADVATLPYDVINELEARTFRRYPLNFYHITRSEIDMPEGTDVHSQVVYDKAKENLDCMIADGTMVQDADPCFYIYELEMAGRTQTGLICGSSIDDYNRGIIKKHEFTRPEKELDRINHIMTTRAQTGVVFLAYRDNDDVQGIIRKWKHEHEPVYNFTADDGVRHTLWVMDDYSKVGAISHLFDTDVPGHSTLPTAITVQPLQRR